MYATILKMLWPYLQRYAARRAAAYLEARKERRLEKIKPPAAKDEMAEELPEPLAKPSGFLANNPVWFLLSGMLLGSALAVALTRLVEPGENS
jgi:hypothetical protein